MRLVFVIIISLCIIYFIISNKKTKYTIPADFVCQGIWDSESSTQFCPDKCAGANLSYKFNITTPFEEEWGIDGIAGYLSACLSSAQSTQGGAKLKLGNEPTLNGNYIYYETGVPCNANYPVTCPTHTKQQSINVRPHLNTCQGFWEYEQIADPKNPGDYTSNCTSFCDSEDHKAFKIIKFTTTNESNDCGSYATSLLRQVPYVTYGYEQIDGTLRAKGTERCTFLRDCGKLCTLVDYQSDAMLQGATPEQCFSGLSTGVYGFSFQDLDYTSDHNLTCTGLQSSQPIDRHAVPAINLPAPLGQRTHGGCPSDKELQAWGYSLAGKSSYFLGAFADNKNDRLKNLIILKPNEIISEATALESLISYIKGAGATKFGKYEFSTIWNQRNYPVVRKNCPTYSSPGGLDGSCALWARGSSDLLFMQDEKKIREMYKNYKLIIKVKMPEKNFTEERLCRCVVLGLEKNAPLPDDSEDVNYAAPCTSDNPISYMTQTSEGYTAEYFLINMVVVPVTTDDDIKIYHRCMAGYIPKLGTDNNIECIPTPDVYYDVCNIQNEDEHPDCCPKLGTNDPGTCSPFCSNQGSACRDLTGVDLRTCLERYYHYERSGREVCTGTGSTAWGPLITPPSGANSVVYLIYNIPTSNSFLYIYLVQYKLLKPETLFDGKAILPDGTEVVFVNKYLSYIKELIQAHTNIRVLEGKYVEWNRPYCWPH